MIAAALLFAGAIAAQGTSVPIREENGVLLLQARVNGRGPMLFTLDPGAADLYTNYARKQLHGTVPQPTSTATRRTSIQHTTPSEELSQAASDRSCYSITLYASTIARRRSRSYQPSSFGRRVKRSGLRLRAIQIVCRC
jgi:hypothetical protein